MRACRSEFFIDLLSSQAVHADAAGDVVCGDFHDAQSKWLICKRQSLLSSHSQHPTASQRMAKTKLPKRSFEIRTRIDGLDIVAAPSLCSSDLDQLLEKRGAASFVFIPLAKPGKRRRSIAKAAARAHRAAELSADDWHDGELRASDMKHAIPGVFAFNIRRRRAREIAGKMGVELFFWGTSGAAVEQHAVKIFADDGTYAWKAIRNRAFDGLKDMFATVRNLRELPIAVQESQTTLRKFWRLVYVVLGVSAAAGLLQVIANESLGAVIDIMTYPVVIPALFTGIYLRNLVRKGEAQARDFTAAEAEANWHIVAPHLLALWAMCLAAVVLLTWLQAVPEADLGMLGRSNDVTTSFIVCVWMLLPIANSRDVKALFSSAVEAGINAAVSILMIKISLYVTDQISDALWGVLAAMLPFVIPERLKEVIDIFIDIGAELFFVAILLGYAWSRTRQQFMRL